MQINTHQAQFETQPQHRNASGRYETESYDKKDKKLNFTLQESAATTCKHKKLKLKQVQEVAAAQSDNECEKLAYTGFYKGIADERKYFKIFPEICVCVAEGEKYVCPKTGAHFEFDNMCERLQDVLQI